MKPENMQYTGAYKLRGAYYKISTLSEEDRAKGLITASAGNMRRVWHIPSQLLYYVNSTINIHIPPIQLPHPNPYQFSLIKTFSYKSHHIKFQNIILTLTSLPKYPSNSYNINTTSLSPKSHYQYLKPY